MSAFLADFMTDGLIKADISHRWNIQGLPWGVPISKVEKPFLST